MDIGILIDRRLTEETTMKKFIFSTLIGLSSVGALSGPAAAGTLTDISFTSNSGSFINDTIINFTSPLAFTAATGLNQPFLNAVDSTISLGYGTYYAISFLGFGAHQGPGTVSFLLDGAPFSQAVTFPNPGAASGVFASFALPGGDSVTISATGLSADRIRIVANGGGLVGDQTPDAFYLFAYSDARQSVIPVPAAGWLLASGLAFMGLSRRLGARGPRRSPA
jgi:hypothetical protein